MGKPRYKFAELVDIAQLQALMDRFSEVIGISNSIVDVNGTRLTSSGWKTPAPASIARTRPRSGAVLPATRRSSTVRAAAHRSSFFVAPMD